MLFRAFSKTIGGDFRRIQFTPDLLPSDLTSINFYNQKSGEFEFRPGPLFSSMILADEINRATPRTQSALLESMEERQVTVDGKTYPMSVPFMVMATQNPIESYGIFPFPEAQVDRFFMRLSMGYMTRSQELSVISRTSTLAVMEELQQVVTPEETAELQQSFLVVFLFQYFEEVFNPNQTLLDCRTRSTGSGQTVERIVPVKREKQPIRQSNRGKVRHLYRQFLKEEQKRGLKRKSSQTSADILRKISPTTDPDAAAALREVYLSARYDQAAEVTPEQVELAR